MTGGFVALSALGASAAALLALSVLREADGARAAVRWTALAATVVLLGSAASAGARAGLALAVLLGGLGLGVALGRQAADHRIPTLLPLVQAVAGLAVGIAGLVGYETAPGHVGRTDGVFQGLDAFVAVVLGAGVAGGGAVHWAKTAGPLSPAPWRLPGRHRADLALALAIAALVLPVVLTPAGDVALVLAALGAAALAAHLALALAPADLPVLGPFLEVCLGLGTAAAGGVLDSDIAVLVGGLLAGGGVIRGRDLAEATGRPTWRVVMGAWGARTPDDPPAPPPVAHRAPADVLDLVRAARSVRLVPGHGVVLGGAEAALVAFVAALHARGTDVRVVLHPAASRLPGFLDVRLALAGLPPDRAASPGSSGDRPDVDLAIALGADGVVNAEAWRDGLGAPHVDLVPAAHRLLVQLEPTGAAGIPNPLLDDPHTVWVRADVSDALAAFTDAVRPPPR